jgi:hypothetical protein
LDPYSGPPVRVARSSVKATGAGPAGDRDEAGGVVVYSVLAVAVVVEGAAPAPAAGVVVAAVAGAGAAAAPAGAAAAGAAGAGAGAGAGGVPRAPFALLGLVAPVASDAPGPGSRSALACSDADETTRKRRQLPRAFMGRTVPRSMERAKHFDDEVVNAMTILRKMLCGGVAEQPAFPGSDVDATHKIGAFLWGH